MQNITIVFSSHLAIGKCNPSELYKIIESINPEVIFEELSVDFFYKVYKEGSTPKSNEVIAIREYLKKYPIKHIPVDTLKKDFNKLFDGYEIIAKRNPEYINLLNKQLAQIKENGYAFLNSSKFDELIKKMQFIEQSVLLKINDQELSKQYDYEKNLHNNRDFVMLRNIYDYSKLNSYKEAMFVCGAEHKKSMVKKISDFERKEEIEINWKYYNPKNRNGY